MELIQLNKHLSPLNVWALAFGCIIGWGAFVMPGAQFLPLAGTIGTIIAHAISACIMIIIALSYSYMVPRFSNAGGEFAFTKECFGNTHAIICGWFLTLAYLANIPMNCTAIGLMTRKLFFGIFQFGKLYSIAGYDIWLGEILLSSIVLLILSYLSICGVKKTGLIQTILSFSLVIAFFIIIVSTLFSPISHFSNLQPFWNLKSIDSNRNMHIINGILSVVAIAPWAYVGFDTIPQAAEEFNFSKNKVNIIMITAISFGCMVYICNSLVIAMASSDWTMFIKQHDWAIGAAIEALMGKPGLIILGIAIISAVLTGILGFLNAASRLLYSIAQYKYLPNWFSHVNCKYHTPDNAIVFCCLISLCGPLFGRTALCWFVDMSAIGTAVGFGYTTIACFATLIKTKKFKDNIFLIISSLLGTCFSICFLFLLLIPGLPGCLSIPSYIMLIAWILLGLLFYFSIQHKKYKI